jgi:ferredoxin
MTDEAYSELREFLDRFPVGFPGTSSGVDIKILKRLFTEEEARAAVLLTPFPESASRIAERTGADPERLAELLGSMSTRGLVFRVRRAGEALYSSAPFMIGLYEYSVNNLDSELAALYREYYKTAYMEEMGASDVQGYKVVPVAEYVESETVLLPFMDLTEQVRSARRISVAECIYRKEAQLLGEGCDYPLETCLSFGAAAEYYIENGMGREISSEEAVRILYDADRAGLVHAGTKTRHLSNIYNCCPCCCASMKGITTRGHDKHRYLNSLFEAVVDGSSCTGCGECVERCPVGALTRGDRAAVDRDQCLGCGLCAGSVPRKRLS